jgi:hypothetical protein
MKDTIMMLLRGMYRMSERKRRDAGQLQLTERDLAVLTWIAQQYCISYDQLHRVLALYGDAPRKDVEKVSYSATINAVQRWLQLGLIDTPHKILRGYSTHVWLSRKGLHQLGLPYAYYVPKASSIPHIYACNAVRFNLQRFNLNATWQAERALKLQTRRAEGTEAKNTPDAELHVQRVPIIAIQVLDPQSISTTYQAQEQVHHLHTLADRYGRLWCFLPDDKVTILQQTVTSMYPDLLQNRLVMFSTQGKDYNTIEEVSRQTV